LKYTTGVVALIQFLSPQKQRKRGGKGGKERGKEGGRKEGRKITRINHLTTKEDYKRGRKEGGWEEGRGRGGRKERKKRKQLQYHYFLKLQVRCGSTFL
jgi:hypothetical protein